jgi:hypothetical protein
MKANWRNRTIAKSNKALIDYFSIESAKEVRFNPLLIIPEG